MSAMPKAGTVIAGVDVGQEIGDGVYAARMGRGRFVIRKIDGEELVMLGFIDHISNSFHVHTAKGIKVSIKPEFRNAVLELL